MRHGRWLAALTLVLGLHVSVGQAHEAAIEVHEAAPQPVLPSVQAAVQQLIDLQAVAGAVVLVAQHGDIVHFQAQGLQEVETQTPMQLDTLFRLYSMTKPITSVATLMLMERGLVGLDDPIGEHLPELANLQVYESRTEQVAPKRPVTVRELLRHTSGMTYGFFSAGPVDRLYLRSHPLLARNQGAMLSRLGALPLAHHPGERWHYGVSTDVLGALVERVSGQSLGAFLQDEIFEPLGMVDTHFQVPADKVDRFASTYGLLLAPIQSASNSPYLRADRLESGGGGLVSTAPDYLRFSQMLLQGGSHNGHRLLQPETVAAMTSNQLPDGVRTAGLYGFGYGVHVTMRNQLVGPRKGQYGWNGAAGTHFWVDPERSLVVVALSQHQPYNTQLKLALTPVVYEALPD